MKIYVVVQHNIKNNVNCISSVFTKIEDAKSCIEWYSQDDNERLFYIQERELYDNFDKEQILAEQTRNIL